MGSDTAVRGTRFGALPAAALSVAPVVLLPGFSLRWYAAALGLLGVAFLAAATWTAHRLRSNLEDDISERDTLAVRLGDTGARRLYLGLVTAAYLVFGGLAWLVPWTAFTLVTALLLALPAWQVRSGAVSHHLDPVIRDTALVALYAAALVSFTLMLEFRVW